MTGSDGHCTQQRGGWEEWPTPEVIESPSEVYSRPRQGPAKVVRRKREKIKRVRAG